MSRASLILRAIAAVLLAGILAPLIVAICANIVFALGTDRGADLEFVGVIWMVGCLAAIPAAGLLGLVCEWPKSIWLAKRADNVLPTHLLLSVLAALFVLFVVSTIELSFAANRTLRVEDYILPTMAFLIGGLCSGTFWWWLVVLPMRKFTSF